MLGKTAITLSHKKYADHYQGHQKQLMDQMNQKVPLWQGYLQPQLYKTQGHVRLIDIIALNHT